MAGGGVGWGGGSWTEAHTAGVIGTTISLALGYCKDGRPGASLDTGRRSLERQERHLICRVTLAVCSAGAFHWCVRVLGSGGLVR